MEENFESGAQDSATEPSVTGKQELPPAREPAEEAGPTEEDVEELYGGGPVPAPEPERVEPSRSPQAESKTEAKPQLDHDDARTLLAIEYEAKQFDRDLRDFALAQQKLAEMAQTNPERAKALTTSVKLAEAELRERYDVLQGAAQTYAQSQWSRRIESERERLHQAVPDLARPESKAALKQYLTRDLGFSEQDLASPTATDHRLAKMAWESLQYRKMMKAASAEKRPAKMPTLPPKRAAKRPDIITRMYGPNPKPLKLPKGENPDLDALYGKAR